jgi:hypothetical protein
MCVGVEELNRFLAEILGEFHSRDIDVGKLLEDFGVAVAGVGAAVLGVTGALAAMSDPATAWAGLRGWGLAAAGLGLALLGVSQIIQDLDPAGDLAGIVNVFNYIAAELMLSGGAVAVTGSIVTLIQEGWTWVNTVQLIISGSLAFAGFVGVYIHQWSPIGSSISL